MKTLNNKTKYMKQILNEWNQFKKTQILNEIYFSKNETKLLIQLIENKNNLNEGILDSLKKFPDFIKKFNVLKDKLNKKGLEKIVLFLKSKIKTLKNLKILSSATSIALVVVCYTNKDLINIEQTTMNNVEITANGETTNIDCGANKLCLIVIGEDGKISVEKSNLSQYELNIEKAKPRDKLLKKRNVIEDDSMISFDELSEQFAKFAEEKQIESGILFVQPEIERQLASVIEENINKISDNESHIFNNTINNNDKQYHLISVYIPKKERTSYKASIEELFKLYEQQLIQYNVDYDKNKLSILKNIYLNNQLKDSLGGFTNGSQFIKDNNIFPAPQVVFMHKEFDTAQTMRHEFMHAVSDFEGLSDFYEQLYSVISIESKTESFDLGLYYRCALDMLRKQYNIEGYKELWGARAYKKEDISKYKDYLNIALRYFIGLGLIKKEKDKDGDYIFRFTATKKDGRLYYGKPNENARHLFDLQKTISDNTTQETFNIIKHVFTNMFVDITSDDPSMEHFKWALRIDKSPDMEFVSQILSSYIKKIDELGPMINDNNKFNSKYLSDTEFANYNINQDSSKSKLNFMFYLNKLSKHQAESVETAIKKIEAELNLHINHMKGEKFNDNKNVDYDTHKESLKSLITRAFSLANLFNNSIK